MMKTILFVAVKDSYAQHTFVVSGFCSLLAIVFVNSDLWCCVNTFSGSIMAK